MTTSKPTVAALVLELIEQYAGWRVQGEIAGHQNLLVSMEKHHKKADAKLEEIRAALAAALAAEKAPCCDRPVERSNASGARWCGNCDAGRPTPEPGRCDCGKSMEACAATEDCDNQSQPARPAVGEMEFPGNSDAFRAHWGYRCRQLGIKQPQGDDAFPLRWEAKLAWCAALQYVEAQPTPAQASAVECKECACPLEPMCPMCSLCHAEDCENPAMFCKEHVEALESPRPTALAELERLRAFYQGMRAGVRRYAWWKDGEQQVGTCGTTFAEARAKVDAEEEAALAAARRGER